MDGYNMVAFCKICSAEGDKLKEDCSGQIRAAPVKITQKILDDERDFVESLLTR
jgi:hypothetical protein